MADQLVRTDADYMRQIARLIELARSITHAIYAVDPSLTYAPHTFHRAITAALLHLQEDDAIPFTELDCLGIAKFAAERYISDG